MASLLSKASKALLGLPFIALSVICIRAMEAEALAEHKQRYIDSGEITWEGGSIEILPRFYPLDFLDDIWRGKTIVFAPSALGFDSVSAWQMSSFLLDLGPIYGVWFLESCRVGNKFTPAYFPTFFAFAAQILGVGTLAPIFYLLCLMFGPSSTDLARSARDFELRIEQVAFVLPIILGLHNAEVFGAYWSPSLETRHYWTWAWQMSPFWIGMLNFITAKVASTFSLSRESALVPSPQMILGVLGSLSAALWQYALAYSPHFISALFLPELAAQADFVSQARRSWQFDEVCAFAGSFLWLLYSVLDLGTAEVSRGDLITKLALLPILVYSIGPGATFALGWYWRETLLEQSPQRVAS